MPLAPISSLFISINHRLRADKLWVLRRVNALAECGRPVISISFRPLMEPRETLTEEDYQKKVALAWLVVNDNENKQIS